MARIDIKSSSTGGGGGGGNLQLASGASMDATLRAVTDTSNTASPLKLSTASVQVNSPLRITTSDASGFYLDAEDSATNNRFSIKRDPSSQEVTLDFASNPTGSTSLVGAIRTYQDGVNLSNAMSFIEDGSVGIGTNTPIGILHLKRTAATTRMVMDGDAGQSKIITYRTAGLQRFGLYVNNTAESGSNVGSDFAIRAYNDAGTLITTPLFIKRSTGFLGIGNVTTPTQQLHVNGSLRIETGGIYDGTNNIGTAGQVLSSTGTATAWITPSAGGTPAGTTGAVQFNNAGAFGADNTNFVWNNTTKALGIGTATPAGALTFGAGKYIEYQNLSSSTYIGEIGINNNLGLQITGNNPIRFLTDSTERMRIFGAGNIAIGSTTDLSAKLGIKGSGSTSATTSLLVQNSAGTSAVQVKDDLSTTFSGAMQVNANITANGLFSGGNVVAGTNCYGPAFYINSGGNAAFGAVVNANASSVVECISTTKGFLPPRMTTAQKNAIGTPAAGLMVYDTDLNKLCVRTAAAWETITSI